ncbi:pentatricopeptide repeat-containing protein At4g02750 [Selaginella moellendorffii]|nr:pentatricopeptide repeat-containing protein At4g02750 [Selaginella moellendorffii]|eukprot:XP_002978383.2 pentatricopeptide repeat-containing protein At4g02750 [Selaginella moellendorffii]
MSRACSVSSIAHRAKEDSFARLLRSCAELQDLSGGKRVHARIDQTEHRHSTYLANLLVNMYAKCGSVNDARYVFDRIQEPNRFSWNIMTCAYAMNGFVELAASFYQMMPDKTVIACTAVIEALGHLGQIERAKTLFDGFPATARDLVCSNAMLAAYARNGHLESAETMLRAMEIRNVVSWNTLLLGYADHGDPKYAKKIFQEMPQRNEVVWLGLIAAFAQRGYLQRVHALFDRMPCHNAGTWSTLIELRSKDDELGRAERLFQRMPLRNKAAWAAMLHAYLRAGNLTRAKDLLDRMPQQEMELAVALIAAYLKSGLHRRAKKSFDRLPWADPHAWSSLQGNITKGDDLPQSCPDELRSPLSFQKPARSPKKEASRPQSRLGSARTGSLHPQSGLESSSRAPDERSVPGGNLAARAAKARNLHRQRLPQACTLEELRSLKQRILLMPPAKRIKWRAVLKLMRAGYLLKKWSSSKIWPRRERKTRP